MKKQNNVRIIGAGVSGLTAAICLAKKGIKVEVIERSSKVGSKYKGDFQGLENWSQKTDVIEFLKHIGVPINFDCEPFDKCHYFDSNLKCYKIRSNKIGFYLVRRGSEKGTLDYGLLETARMNGVEVVFDKNIKIQPHDIVATGISKPHLKAYGINFETDLHKTAYAIFDNKLAPFGYSYFLVVNGKATIAVVSTITTENMKNRLSAALKRFHEITEFDITNMIEFAGVGTKYLHTKTSNICVGESGGFQDAMWGFGLRLAFLTGHYAAVSIANNTDYNKLLENELIPICKSSIVNRKIYDRIVSKNYKLFLNMISKSKDPVAFANKLYSYPIIKRISYHILQHT